MKKYLVGSKIRLVKFTERHITARYLEWLNDHEVNRYLFVGREPLVREQINLAHNSNKHMFFAIMCNLMYDDSNDSFVQYPDYSQYVGTASIGEIDWISRRGEIGYMIGEKNYWGAGIATDVISLLSDYCLNRINMNKVEAGVIEGNIGSMKALEKNEFREYGIIPQEYYLEGRYLNCHKYYKLQDWVK